MAGNYEQKRISKNMITPFLTLYKTDRPLSLRYLARGNTPELKIFN
jgi:hypothetical protein